MGNGPPPDTQADTIASAVAGALSSDFEVSLTYCFEKEGVLDTEGRLIEVIDQAGYETLKAEGVVSGGMLPKIDNAFSALRKGIRVVRITSAASPEGGTLIRL